MLLKGRERYKGISITEDYTETERRMVKLWIEKVKAKNMEQPNESNFIWKLRGSPREGFWMKIILKNNKNTTKVKQNCK